MVLKPKDAIELSVTFDYVIRHVDAICNEVLNLVGGNKSLVGGVWGPPKNGTILAAIAQKRWGFQSYQHLDELQDRGIEKSQNNVILIIDDIVSGGHTLMNVMKNKVQTSNHWRVIIATLFANKGSETARQSLEEIARKVITIRTIPVGCWIVFPWETASDEELDGPDPNLQGTV